MKPSTETETSPRLWVSGLLKNRGRCGVWSITKNCSLWEMLRNLEVRGHCMGKERPVLLVNRVLDTKKEEGTRSCWSINNPTEEYCSYHTTKLLLLPNVNLVELFVDITRYPFKVWTINSVSGLDFLSDALAVLRGKFSLAVQINHICPHRLTLLVVWSEKNQVSKNFFFFLQCTIRLLS
jgi:hypothetical protein